jgi:hypothetical protein
MKVDSDTESRIDNLYLEYSINPKEGLRVAILLRQVGSQTGKWHFFLGLWQV